MIGVEFSLQYFPCPYLSYAWQSHIHILKIEALTILINLLPSIHNYILTATTPIPHYTISELEEDTTPQMVFRKMYRYTNVTGCSGCCSSDLSYLISEPVPISTAKRWLKIPTRLDGVLTCTLPSHISFIMMPIHNNWTPSSQFRSWFMQLHVSI